MELAQIYEMLNGVEGGADAIASLKKEFTTLRNEAKENRISKEEILKALNLQNGEAGKQQAETLSALAERLRQTNTTPADMLSKMNALEKSITDLTAKYEARTKEAEAEKQKRIATATRSQLISALSKGNAVNPEQYATLPALTGAIVVGDNDTLGFKSGDKTVSISDGVNAWLKDNAWAVKSTSQGGAGSHGPLGNAGKHFSMEDIRNMSREEINKNWETIKKGVTE